MNYETTMGGHALDYPWNANPAVTMPARATSRNGWRDWPWRIIIFLHVMFLMANVDIGNLPFPAEENATVNQIQLARDEGMPLRRVAFLILGTVSIVSFALTDRKRFRVRTVLSALMVVFLVWSCMSLLWADDRDFASRKILVFFLMWLGAGWAGFRLSPINLLRFAFISNFLTFVTCVGVEMAFGHFRPWVAGYRLGGLYHPNETGQCLAVATVAAIALGSAAISNRKRQLALGYYAAGVIAFCGLIITGSRTSLSCLIVAIAAFWVIVATARYRAARALVIAIVLGVVAMGVLYVFLGPDLMTTLKSLFTLGRDDSDITTLTMRTPMWHEVIHRYIADRPLLGYGYGSFWTMKHIIAMSLLQRGAVYFHSHSGYLEMALSIGVIGAAVHVATLVLGGRNLIAEYRKEGDWGAAFGGALIVMLMVSMFTEPTNMSAYLMPTFLDMVFLMYTAFGNPPMAKRTLQRITQNRWLRYEAAPSL